MYPARELTRLAERKARLRQAIAHRRVHCAEIAARVTWPLAWLDRMIAWVRQVSPLVLLTAIPLGCLLKRSIFSRFKRVLGLVGGAVRGFRFAIRTFSPSAK